jgi:hypothetical protein
MLIASGTAVVGRAAVLGSVKVEDNSTTADLDDNRRQVRSSSEVKQGGTFTQFFTGHHHIVAADAGIGFRQEARPSMRFTVKAQVNAAPDELWQLNLDSVLKGKVFVRDDTGPGSIESANAYMKSFGFNYTSKNALLSKDTLLMAEDFETGTNTDDADIDVNESRDAIFSGRGSQEVVIDLTWESYADSKSNEAAVRFGMDHTMSGFILGDAVGGKVAYPSNSTPKDDGYFLDGTLKSPGRAFAMTLQSVASRIDVTDGFELPINFSPGVNFVTGLTLSASKDVFGVSRVSNGAGGFDNSLFRVNPNTGIAQNPVTLNLNEPNNVQGLELIGINPDQLFVLNSYAPNAQSLHLMNRNGQSLARNPLIYDPGGPFKTQVPQVIDLAYDSKLDILYGWDVNNGLVTIDRNTGFIFDQISFSGGPIEAIAFDDQNGTLYGIGHSGLYTINTTNEQDILISDPDIYGDFGDLVILDESFYKANLMTGKRNVLIDPRGDAMTGFMISSPGPLELDLSQLVLPPSATWDSGPNFLSVTGLDATQPFDIGPIFPAGLSASEFEQYSFQYARSDGILRDGNALLAVPEPATLVMLSFSVATLFCRVGRIRRFEG